jgi:hypothetical protein
LRFDGTGLISLKANLFKKKKKKKKTSDTVGHCGSAVLDTTDTGIAGSNPTLGIFMPALYMLRCPLHANESMDLSIIQVLQMSKGFAISEFYIETDQKA